MNTVEASLVMAVVIFSIMYMITFSLTFTRKTNTYITGEINREHTAYTKNNKKFYPDDAKRITTIIDNYFEQATNSNTN